jgi:hypothetical protein
MSGPDGSAPGCLIDPVCGVITQRWTQELLAAWLFGSPFHANPAARSGRWLKLAETADFWAVQPVAPAMQFNYDFQAEVTP